MFSHAYSESWRLSNDGEHLQRRSWAAGGEVQEWDPTLPTFYRSHTTVFNTPERPYGLRMPHALHYYAQANGNVCVKLVPLILDPIDDDRVSDKMLHVAAHNRIRIAQELLAAQLIAFHDYVRILERNGRIPHQPVYSFCCAETH
jgi:hypothetical protein